MPLERISQKSFRAREIAPLAEPELNCIAIAVNSAVQIRPASSDLDVRFIEMPFPAEGRLCRLKRSSNSGE
jgi:hypothetical protein